LFFFQMLFTSAISDEMMYTNFSALRCKRLMTDVYVFAGS